MILRLFKTGIGYAVYFLLIVIWGCTPVKKFSNPSVSRSVDGDVWYKQADVELGAVLQMETADSGLAISRGRGEDVPGRAYVFRNGDWDGFHKFPYSDYPLISRYSANIVWTINHLTHYGDYRPVHSSFRNGRLDEVWLPSIMWDVTDYVMWKDWDVLNDGTAWMVGQQGHILYFNGTSWLEFASPALQPNQDNYFTGDLNGISMLNPEEGWAVGRDGLILHFEGGEWFRQASPVTSSLNDVTMISPEEGWAAGENGVVLHYRRGQWRREQIESVENLNGIHMLDRSTGWIAGTNSLLLTRQDSSWQRVPFLKNFDDDFADVSAVYDSAGKKAVWIIGDRGIYTNHQTMGFSFTDITGQASLRRTGIAGTFLDFNHDGRQDLYVIEEDGRNLLYRNTGARSFVESTLDAGLTNAPTGARTTAYGDVNNDGYMDIFLLRSDGEFRLYFGTSSGKYIDFSTRSQLAFPSFNPDALLGAQFVDLNNDGGLDLYVSAFNQQDLLFANNGAGQFRRLNIADEIAKSTHHRSPGAAFADVDGDNLTDVIISYQVPVDRNVLEIFINQGQFRFTKKPVPASRVGNHRSNQSSVCIPGDFNNDGHTDLAVYHFKAPPWILFNNGHGEFQRADSDIGFDAVIPHREPNNGIMSAGDLNNDGYLDLVISGHIFLNNGGKYFTEISDKVGVDFAGTPTLADYDRDGDTDIYYGSSRLSYGRGDRAALYRNNLNRANWIKFHVLGDESNRAGIGTTVLLTIEHSPSDNVVQKRVAGLASNPLTAQELSSILFGVQPGKQYQAQVTFPSGVVQTVKNILPGTTVQVTETAGIARQLQFIKKSIHRTLQLLEMPTELLKGLTALLIIVSVLVLSKYLGTERYIRRWFFVLPLILFYLSMVHLTILFSGPTATVIQFGTLSVTIAVYTFGAYRIAERRASQFISHYKLQEPIGEGGMGKVYRGVDTQSREMVAIKILHRSLLKDPENRRRLSGEGQMLSSFQHPHIVHVYEFGETGDRGYLVMEHLTRGTLQEYISANHPLEVGEFIRFSGQICSGLNEIHNHNVIHRDIKSGNIMLDEDHNIRIMDFGLSGTPLVTRMTSLGTVVGTLGYVAPEQITNISIDHRADIFSLGVVLYEMLTGILPFTGENEMAVIHAIFNTSPPPPSQVRPNLPAEFDTVVASCLEKQPENRIHSADQVWQKLKSYQQNSK